MAGIDLRKMREEAAAAEEGPELAANLVSRDLTINVRYVSPDGDEFREALTATILSGDERITVARMAARLAGGVNWDFLPVAQRQYVYMLSWLTVALKDPPDWFSRWVQEDTSLMLAVYQEVEAHESAYFCRDTEEGHVGSPRVQVSSSLSSNATKEQTRPVALGS